jgi:hypothetical protein
LVIRPSANRTEVQSCDFVPSNTFAFTIVVAAHKASSPRDPEQPGQKRFTQREGPPEVLDLANGKATHLRREFSTPRSVGQLASCRNPPAQAHRPIIRKLAPDNFRAQCSSQPFLQQVRRADGRRVRASRSLADACQAQPCGRGGCSGRRWLPRSGAGGCSADDMSDSSGGGARQDGQVKR